MQSELMRIVAGRRGEYISINELGSMLAASSSNPGNLARVQIHNVKCVMLRHRVPFPFASEYGKGYRWTG